MVQWRFLVWALARAIATKDISLCPRPCHFNNGLSAAATLGPFDCPGYFDWHGQNNDLQAATFLFHKSPERPIWRMSVVNDGRGRGEILQNGQSTGRRRVEWIWVVRGLSEVAEREVVGRLFRKIILVKVNLIAKIRFANKVKIKINCLNYKEDRFMIARNLLIYSLGMD